MTAPASTSSAEDVIQLHTPAHDKKTYANTSQLIAAEEPFAVLNHLPELPEDSIATGDLRKFLTANIYPSGDGKRSQWVKMVCLYDWLVYGRQIKPSVRRPRRRRPRAKKSGGEG